MTEHLRDLKDAHLKCPFLLSLADQGSDHQPFQGYFDESADVNRMSDTGTIVASLRDAVLATQTKTAAKIESDDTD